MSTEVTYIFFCSHKPAKTGWLSNWFKSKFTEDDIMFNCVEQYMMYKKAQLMGDDVTAEQILGLSDPKTIKAAGRKVKPFDADLWDEHKVEIVTQGLRLKFSQNKQVRSKLLKTGTDTLVEAAHYDKVWGNGLRENHPDSRNPDRWLGQNLLGQCLMTVRAEMMAEEQDEKSTPSDVEDRCVAITKAGTRCRYKPKTGDLCGRHVE
jgi:ribA/ribD-fused uncharacterized protein